MHEYIIKSWYLLKDAMNPYNPGLIRRATDDLFRCIKLGTMETQHDYMSFKNKWYNNLKNKKDSDVSGRITLIFTPEEAVALANAYSKQQQYFMWCGLLAVRDVKLPTCLDQLNILKIDFNTYEITKPI
jgi:hypothetical protein